MQYTFCILTPQNMHMFSGEKVYAHSAARKAIASFVAPHELWSQRELAASRRAHALIARAHAPQLASFELPPSLTWLDLLFVLLVLLRCGRVWRRTAVACGVRSGCA